MGTPDISVFGGRAEDSVEIQRRMEGAQAYNRWLVDQVADWLGRRVVDVGSASGNITRLLLPRERVIAMEPAGQHLAELTRRLGSDPAVRVVEGTLSPPVIETIRTEKPDTVASFNVLEHIEDDLGALKAMASVLEPGGHLALVVPAMPLLYGSVDRVDGHYRRYTKGELVRKTEAAGFHVASCRFMNLPGAFGWFFNYRILKLAYPPEGAVGLFDRLVPAIRAIEGWIPPPLGQSLVLKAERV
jgi:SAM-dependent methyltransferase